MYGFFNCSEPKLHYEIGADYMNELTMSRLRWVQTHYLPKMESTCLPGMPSGTFSKSIRFISHTHLLKTHKKVFVKGRYTWKVIGQDFCFIQASQSDFFLPIGLRGNIRCAPSPHIELQYATVSN